MKTFILLTFGFLGFAFYEMSGGSDFEPASARMADATVDTQEAVQVEKVVAQQPAPVVTSTTASITKIDNTPDVTRVSLNLTNVGAAQAVATDQPAPATAQIIDSTETPQIILPSLIATTNRNGTDVNGDVRKVSGNRVNVRGGPSTNYGVVSKLTRGAEVVILEDNGDGWVKMRPVDGGETGWMADFLLTSG